MTHHLSKSNIILCGLPGVGKTSVGRLLARKMDRAFIDTDDQIEEKVGMSCRSYYHKAGRQAFRAVESDIILQLMGCGNRVIALGGGCVESPNVIANIKMLGSVIHLCNDIDFLVQRKVNYDRPAYIKGGKDYRQLAAERLPLYYSVADFNLHLSETGIPQAVEMIIREMDRIYGK